MGNTVNITRTYFTSRHLFPGMQYGLDSHGFTWMLRPIFQTRLNPKLNSWLHPVAGPGAQELVGPLTTAKIKGGIKLYMIPEKKINLSNDTQVIFTPVKI